MTLLLSLDLPNALSDALLEKLALIEQTSPVDTFKEIIKHGWPQKGTPGPPPQNPYNYNSTTAFNTSSVYVFLLYFYYIFILTSTLHK